MSLRHRQAKLAIASTYVGVYCCKLKWQEKVLERSLDSVYFELKAPKHVFKQSKAKLSNQTYVNGGNIDIARHVNTFVARIKPGMGFRC